MAADPDLPGRRPSGLAGWATLAAVLMLIAAFAAGLATCASVAL